MKSKKANEYLNRVYKVGNAQMKAKVYSREVCNKAIDRACLECESTAIEVLDSVLSFCGLCDTSANEYILEMFTKKIKEA